MFLIVNLITCVCRFHNLFFVYVSILDVYSVSYKITLLCSGPH